MPRRSNVDHVVVDGNTGGTFRCGHCGAEYKPTYPIEILMYVATGKAFTKTHARCRKVADKAVSSG